MNVTWSYLVYEKRQCFQVLWSVQNAVHYNDRSVALSAKACQQQQQQEQGALSLHSSTGLHSASYRHKGLISCSPFPSRSLRQL